MSSERTFFFNDSRNISEFVIPNGYTKSITFLMRFQ